MQEQLTVNKAPGNAQEIFSGNFTVWNVRTTAARFKSRLAADDLGLKPEDIDENVSLGQKDMLPGKDRIYLNQASGQVQSFMRLVSKPFFARGLYAVPDSKLLAARQGLERIREAQKERVEEFLTRYGEVMQQQQTKHPNLVNVKWPTPDEVRAYFSITWNVFSVSAAEARATDPDELIEAKQEFKADLKQAYEELRDNILGESYQAILETIDGFLEKLQAGEKITETNFKRPRQIIENYLSIASVFDLPEVQAKVQDLENEMNSINARTLRERPLSAKIFAEKIKELGQGISNLTGYSKDGRMKRTLDLDDDEPTAAAAE